MSCWLKVKEHIEPVDIDDDFAVAGSILSTPAHPVKLWYFLIFRVLFTIYSTVIFSWSWYNHIVVAENDWAFYFVLVTHWGLVMNLIYFWSISILNFQAYFLGKDVLRKTCLFKCAQFLLNTGTSFAFLIILLYWAAIYPVLDADDKNPLPIVSWHTHGIQGGLILIEYYTSCMQLSGFGMISGPALSLTWATTSIIFWAAGGTNTDGDKYIYPAVDWGKNAGLAAGLSVMTAVLVLLFHYVFLITKKTIITKCWLKKKNGRQENVASEIARGRHEQQPSNISDIELGQNLDIL